MGQKNTILAIRNKANAIEVDENKQNNQSDKKCCNYVKKGYFLRNCSKSLKN